MYQYIDTFLIENVSMCRYKYILKVSDTYIVSNTKGRSAHNQLFSIKNSGYVLTYDTHSNTFLIQNNTMITQFLGKCQSEVKSYWKS